jgi:hypothetical protein
MIEATIEKASITYRWTFERILWVLPGPGTPIFAALSKALHPYGIPPSAIVLEAPTSKLDDVILGISLSDPRATLRLSYGWFELDVNDLYDEDIPALIKIVELVFAALSEADEDVHRGRATFHHYAHISLSAPDPEAFLAEHLPLSRSVSGLIPDALAYKPTLSGRVDIQEMRAVITKSLAFNNAVFIQFTVEYISSGTPAQSAERFTQDHLHILELLGLKLNTSPEGEGTK